MTLLSMFVVSVFPLFPSVKVTRRPSLPPLPVLVMGVTRVEGLFSLRDAGLLVIVTVELVQAFGNVSGRWWRLLGLVWGDGGLVRNPWRFGGSWNLSYWKVDIAVSSSSSVTVVVVASPPLVVVVF